MGDELRVVGRTGSAVWITDEEDGPGLQVWPQGGDPNRRRPLASVLVMANGGFEFDEGWGRE